MEVIDKKIIDLLRKTDVRLVQIQMYLKTM